MPATFTIAIPTHNRRETVVLSACSALRQTRPPAEVIVLCDGCTDDTEAALEELGDDRLVVLSLRKLSGYAYAHRNVALERAHGTAIIWVGDDDLLLPDHLERLGALWDTGLYDLVTAPAVVVHPDDTLEWLGDNWAIERNRIALERRNGNVMAGVSIRATLARDAGGWDASIPRAGDWDLWRRALAAGGRAGAIGDATVLHFRATGRDQPWDERVRQNTLWFERLSRPDGLASIERSLGRLRDEREVAVLERLFGCERELEHLRGTRWWRLRVWLAGARGRARRARAGG